MLINEVELSVQMLVSLLASGSRAPDSAFGVGPCYDFNMKVIILALCLAVVVVSVWFIWPKIGGDQFLTGGPTPSSGAIRDSVFRGIPRGLQ
jgi:hypothetical protein